MMRPQGLPASNHFHSHKKADLLAEYAYLWSGASIAPEWNAGADKAIRAAIAQASLYHQVAQARNVPWLAIAALDMRESGADPGACLANGDPWAKKTTHYPSGNGPWLTKLDSCIWALDDYQRGWVVDFHKIKWDICEMLYLSESFNGFNPRIDAGTIPADASGYVYSGAVFDGKHLYEKGKRKEARGPDGRMHGYFDPAQVDMELGCMAFFLAAKAKGMDLASL